MNEIQAEKLDKFMTSVNSDVDSQIKSMLEDADALRNETLSKAEDEALYEAYGRIQRSVRDIESGCRREYAMKQQGFRTDVLKHREELTERIFSSVRNKIAEFTESDKYEEYLVKLVNSENAGKNAFISVSAKDAAHSDVLEKKTGMRVETNSGIKLGGLEIVDPDRGIVIDKTLDSALEEQRKNFSSRYSFKADGGVKE